MIRRTFSRLLIGGIFLLTSHAFGKNNKIFDLYEGPPNVRHSYCAESQQLIEHYYRNGEELWLMGYEGPITKRTYFRFKQGNNGKYYFVGFLKKVLPILKDNDHFYVKEYEPTSNEMNILTKTLETFVCQEDNQLVYSCDCAIPTS